ncbi:MAG: integration host factor subunit beta [Elusimicrobiaceae bacterium]|nr:integration host factor subunit beta [Elusimicrobiaceae bacterium]
MNKEDIIQALSTYLFDRKQAKTAVEATLAIMKDALKKGDKVVLSNFGTFKAKETNPITLKNPKTGKEIKVPSKMKVRFKASKNILEDTNDLGRITK